MHADVIVVGAGIHGSSSALALARAGLSVMVFEQSYPGRHASGVNAGGVRRLGRHLAEVPLSDAAMKVWLDVENHFGDTCGFKRTGQIKVAESDADWEVLQARVKEVQGLGYDHEELIEQAELKRLLPAVADHCVGGILCRDDGCALPFQTVAAMRLAAEKAGVVFYRNSPVNAIMRQSDSWHVETPNHRAEAKIIINCAGAWGPRIAKMLGDDVSISMEAPMLMITERMPLFCGPVVGATSRTLSFKQFENGTVLIGGGYRGMVNPETHTTTLDWKGLSDNAITAQEIFPLMKGVRINRCWAGIEGVTSDQIPIISQGSRWQNVYHMFGFSAHGFQLGMITGDIISELVIHGESTLPIDAFSIKRFMQ